MSLPPDRPMQLLNGVSDHDRTGELLERYLSTRTSGTMDPEVRVFAESHQALIRTVETLRGAWHRELAPGEMGAPGELAIARLIHEVTERRLRSAQTQATSRTRGLSLKRQTLWRRRRGYVVAGVTACMGALIAVVVMQGRGGGAPSRAEKTYATVAGQQAIVALPNGTQAVLGPSTTLRVEAMLPGGGVTVTLQGKAVFAVAHQHRAPFTVRTKNVSTRVLGTTFLVRQYAAERTARVVVLEGRVSLHPTRPENARPHKPGTVLPARTLGVVDDSGNVRVTPNVSADDDLAWTTGHLVFHQTPVQEIIAELSRAYGADLRLTDSTLSTRAFTWSVSVTQSTLADALDVLTTALDAHVVQSGDVFTIVPGAVTPRKSSPPRTPHSLEKQYGR
jgi:transmembrane sensor